MADGKRWTSMNSNTSSRRFGLYAEKRSGKPQGGRSRRCWFFLAILLAAVIVICLTALSISTGKGRKKLMIVVDSKAEEAVDILKKTFPLPTLKTTESTLNLTNEINATTQSFQTVHEESISRPEEASSTSSFNILAERDAVDASTTAFYERTDILGTEEPATSEPLIRQGRIINDPATSPFRMRLPPRFAYSPAPHPRSPSRGQDQAYVVQNDQISFPDRSEIIAFHPQNYEDRYAQMEQYKNGLMNTQILNLAANDRQTSIFSKAPAVKITGIYVRGPAEELENFNMNERDQLQTQLNGHAYMSDPLKKYKPAHPSEINHLATLTSELDTGYRFANKIRGTVPPVGDAEMGASSSSDLTEAIFHPYEPALDSSLPAVPVRDEKKSRPLKIMLDIYPLHQPDLQVQGSSTDLVRPRLPPQRTGRQPSKPLPAPPLPTVPPPTQPSRMIVHLNLFPKKTPKNGQRRTTPLPAVMTFVPGGGSQFQDRMFDAPNGSAENGAEEESISVEKQSNEDESDQSIEIAETYPVINGDEMVDRKDTVSAFVFSHDQVMEPSSTYRFVIADDAVVEGDKIADSDFGEEQEVYTVFDESGEDSEETGDKRHEKTRQYFEKEDEGSRNGYKVVSFEVTSGGGGGGSDVINEGGIVRSKDIGNIREEEENGGKSVQHSSEDGTGNADGEDYEAYDNPVDGVGSQSSGEEKKQRDPLHDGIRIKSIKGAKDFGNGRQNDHMMYPDDGGEIPVGVAVEDDGKPHLDFVPGYNEGAIIEPRYDTISASSGFQDGRQWWPGDAVWQSEPVSITTGRPIVFPTSAEEPTQPVSTTPLSIHS